MQRICFKRRNGSLTVQLVRHAYCPSKKRSRTITIGSFPVSADPEDFLPDLRLTEGMTLTEDDCRLIAQWLIENGDPESARRRHDAAERVAARLREALRAESAPAGDAFDIAEKALEAAATELPEIAVALRERGEDVWAALRHRYLRLLKAWEHFQSSAQEAGITKKKRGGEPSGSAIQLQGAIEAMLGSSEGGCCESE